MNRSIEQALLSLLPTLNSSPPQQLVELASSFLAQSRHRASTLKAEEEIARPYACAHIACNRLKTSLNLPHINEGGAPIPPRLYKRLYTHLDRVLEVTSLSGRSTPGRAQLGSSRAQSNPSSSDRPLPSRPTPSKDKSLSQFRSPSAKTHERTPSRATRAAGPHPRQDDSSLPPWMAPTLSFIAKDLSQPRLAPIAMAGLRSILVPHGRRTDSVWLRDHVAGVVCTVFLYVWTSTETLRHPEKGRIEREGYAAMRKQVIDSMAKARKEVELSVEESVAWAEWSQPSSDVLDKTMTLLNRQGLLEGDWTGGIADLVRSQEGQADVADEADDEVDGEQDLEQARARKADTMLQDRYDYTSERRRREYAQWKEGMMKRIRQIRQDKSEQMQLQ